MRGNDAQPRSGLMKQSWKNRHHHQPDGRSREDAEANWMVCAVKRHAAVSKTLTAWDAADNASKHAPKRAALEMERRVEIGIAP